jgi:hypothetical protein
MNWTEYARWVRAEIADRRIVRVHETTQPIVPPTQTAPEGPPEKKQTRWQYRDRIRAFHEKLGLHSYMQCPGTKCSARQRPL